MYQQSRKMLIFLCLILSAVTITCGVITGIASASNASTTGKLELMDERDQAHVYQRSSSSPAPINALIREEAAYF
jgi:ABC-type phosphate transport system substrate-binding protein